jgi:PBP1b-binding outer membrane lipoprotein LpoB
MSEDDVSENNASENKSTEEKIICPDNIERLELADIDYLLYANKMIDSMIQNKAVQTKTTNSRMRLSLSPIAHSRNDVDLNSLNTAIKNRILRSGLFVVVDGTGSANYQLSGIFKAIHQSNTCNVDYEEFSLQLKDIRTDKILWSDKKRFN